MILQKLKKEVDDDFIKAEYYYSILSAINNLHLTEREIQLVAYTAAKDSNIISTSDLKGNITYANVREEFCKKYKTSGPTINNIISKLKKLKIFIKEDGKVKVNPVIVIDFSKNIMLNITLNGKA